MESNITTSLEVITPGIAQEWLALNIDNRPLRSRWVADLVARMESGQWKTNGDTICFNGTR